MLYGLLYIEYCPSWEVLVGLFFIVVRTPTAFMVSSAQWCQCLGFHHGGTDSI